MNFAKRNLFSRALRAVLFLVAAGLQPTAAQIVLFSVTGPSGPTALSGDVRHRYEFWVQPTQGQDSASIEIFDAALGGTADIVQGADAMTTTFSLYRFDDLYASTDLPLTRVAGSPKPLASLQARDEVRYTNRWTTLARVAAGSSGRGWIVSVEAGPGNDVNAFKLDVRDLATGRPTWRLTAFDLSLCLYNVTPGYEVQVRSVNHTWGNLPRLAISGAEGAPVIVRNDEGDQRRLSEPARGGSSQAAWGIAIGSSPGAINNLVVSDPDGRSLWDARPVVVQTPRRPPVSVLQLAGDDCRSRRLVLSGSRTAGRTVRPVWRYGDRTFEGDTIGLKFPQFGKHIVQVLVPSYTSTLPRMWREDVSVVLHETPKAVLTVNRTVAGPKDPLVFDASRSVDPDRRPVAYRWLVNGALRATGTSLRLEGLLPGAYLVRLEMQAQDAYGICATSAAEREVRVNGQPYAEIDGRAIVGAGSPLTLQAVRSNDVDGDPLTYSWTGTGFAGTKSGPSITLTQERPGTYELKLVVDDATGTGNATYEARFRYRVNAAPVVAFSIPPRIAPGDRLRLSASQVSDADRDRLTYEWHTSDGQQMIGRDVDVMWPDSGWVDVTLRVDDGVGVENSAREVTHAIRVSPPVVPAISGATLTAQSRQRFSAASTIVPDPRTVTYGWAFGDGATASGPEVTHVFQKPGVYRVGLTTNDGLKLSNSVQTVSHEVTVNAFPLARIEAPAVWEPGRPLRASGAGSVDPDGSIASYEWSVDGRSVGASAEAEITLPAAGVHTLALKVKDDSGLEEAVGVATRQVRANAPPVPRFTVTPAAAAPGQKVVFDASPSLDPDGTPLRSFAWKIGNAAVRTGRSVETSFAQSGRVTFTLEVDDGEGMSNSSATLEGSLLVNSAPIIVTERSLRVSSQRVVLDASASYDPDGDAVSVTWTLPDRTTQTGSTLSWLAPTRGVQFLTVTADDGRGLANSRTRETVRIIVNRPPVAVVDSLIFSCSGRPVLFSSARCSDADGDPILATWDFGDGTSSTESNPVHRYARAGLYTVLLRLSDGMSDEPVVARIPVIVEDSPTAFMDLRDTTLCTGVSLQLSGEQSFDSNGPIVTYAWDLGNGTVAEGPRVTTSYLQPGDYVVTLTVTGSGTGTCPRTHQTTGRVRVVAGPVAEFSLPSIISIGDTVALDASESALNGRLGEARWTIDGPGSQQTLSGLKASFVPLKAGPYSVRLRVAIDAETNCSTSEAVRIVNVNAPPTARFEGPLKVALGATPRFDASGSSDPDGLLTSFRWTIDGVAAATGPVLAVPFTSRGPHIVRLTVTDNSGTRTSTDVVERTVEVNAAPRAQFTLRGPFYEGQALTLKADETADADGQALTLTWMYDGAVISGQPRPLTPGRHSILLRADDGQGMSNSVDSLVQEFYVTPAPTLDVPLPTDWAQGTTLKLREFATDPAIVLIGGRTSDAVEIGSSAGPQEVQIAWVPAGEVLKRSTHSVTVWEPLRFTSEPAPLTMTWNPANPRAVLTAPPVNRPSVRPLTYEWYRGGELVGSGPWADVLLVAGETRFSVKVSDQGIVGSRPATTTVIVRCE